MMVEERSLLRVSERRLFGILYGWVCGCIQVVIRGKKFCNSEEVPGYWSSEVGDGS